MRRSYFLKQLIALPFGAQFVQKYVKDEQKSRCLINKFYVAGFQYYAGPEQIKTFTMGETLRLQAVPENYYDRFAVEIHREGVMLGHIPHTDNKHISRLLQQGVSLNCKVAKVSPNAETWRMLQLKLFL